MSNQPFPVDIGDNLTVGHLKDEIVKKNPASFDGVDGYTIELWMTSLPIDKQLKNQVNNQKFLENDMLQEGIRLSKLFPPPGPAEETLHIVIRHPLPQSKRLKLDGGVEISGLQMLWEHTWNRKEEAVPWFSLRKTERDGTSTEVVPEYCWILSLPDDITLALQLNPPTVLFRDDYWRVLKDLFTSSGLARPPNPDCKPGTFPNFFSGVQVPHETPENGFILTGYPGTGKSIWLRIILILRLCARLPTFYQTKESSTVFFSDKGPSGTEFSSTFDLASCLHKEPTAWALFDSSPSFKHPPDIFMTMKNFMVQTPSPRKDRMEWKAKSPPIAVCCLRLWTPAELICAAPLQRRCHSERALVDFCKKFGYSARDAYGNVSTADKFERSLRDYCSSLSYDTVAEISRNAQRLHFPEKVSHNIICFAPTEDGLHFSFDFASEHVFKLVLESLRKSVASAAGKLYRLFLTHTYTKAPAGYMLEPAARDILGEGGSFDIIRLERSQGSVNIIWKTPQNLTDVQTRLHITSSGISVGEVRVSPMGQPLIFQFRKEGRLDQFGLYCPTNKNQAMFDYLVYNPVDKHAWVFQVTSSPSHTAS